MEKIKHYLTTSENRSIYQVPGVVSFSFDSILLAAFSYIPKRAERILDFCTGNAPVPLLLSTQTTLPIDAVELQEELVHLAQENIEMNNMQHQITVHQGDIKSLPETFVHGTYDVITCNPPYFKTSSRNHQNSEHRQTIARHEIMLTFEEMVQSAKKLLNNKGKLYIVHRPSRLNELLQTLDKHNMPPKRIQLVYPKHGKEANTLLIEAIKNGGEGMRIEPPLFVYHNDGTHTQEIRDIFERLN